LSFEKNQRFLLNFGAVNPNLFLDFSTTSGFDFELLITTAYLDFSQHVRKIQKWLSKFFRCKGFHSFEISCLGKPFVEESFYERFEFLG
jgi:hypothetical protein